MLQITARFFRPWLGRAFCLIAAMVAVSGCGGGSSGPGPASGQQATSLTSNEHRIYVDSGPTGTGYNANRLYADVTICQPGNPSNCQTIDHVLVDTGSTGLRLLAGLVNPALGLKVVSAQNGQALLNCVKFVDNTFAWGPVVEADVKLSAKQAVAAPIQLVADSRYDSLAPFCDSGSQITSPATLGANGILGIGLFLQDCGAACEVSAVNPYYFTCTNALCLSAQRTTVARGQQLQNPVSLFASDNNGVAIELPAVGTSPTPGVTGKMVFGIGTRNNNQPGNAKVLSADALGYITTVFEGRVMPRSFIDSGSNGLFFDSTTLPTCAGGNVSGFYCPAGLTVYSATLVGDNAIAASVSFTVDNAVNSFVGTNPVLPNLSGTFSNPQSFDWGLPFFYGKKVYYGFDGRATPVGTGPFYAF